MRLHVLASFEHFQADVVARLSLLVVAAREAAADDEGAGPVEAGGVLRVAVRLVAEGAAADPIPLEARVQGPGLALQLLPHVHLVRGLVDGAEPVPPVHLPDARREVPGLHLGIGGLDVALLPGPVHRAEGLLHHAQALLLHLIVRARLGEGAARRPPGRYLGGRDVDIPLALGWNKASGVREEARHALLPKSAAVPAIGGNCLPHLRPPRLRVAELARDSTGPLRHGGGHPRQRHGRPRPRGRNETYKRC
mmetsp:Transcript_81612/g.231312  ORF Transcript_81612/g.231312 Transcript_81612/m.231312 type:complete len:251 (+) Transcript_81612:915-1667(+)